MISGFFLTSILLFLGSILFHLFCNYSEKLSYYLSKVDYIGIVLLNIGGSIPMYYYGFYCSLVTKTFYMVGLVIIVCLSCIVIISERFSSPAMHPLRFVLFAALALWNAVPILHLCLVNGFWLVIGTWNVLTSHLVFLCGGLLYLLRIPERFAPGRFDTVGNSHQLMHVATILGICVHYHACILNMINYHVNETCTQ